MGKNLLVKAEKRFTGRNPNLFPFSKGNDKLPSRYRDTNLALILRDPSWVYCYWDIEDRILIDLKSKENFSGLVLRITELEGLSWAQESRIDWFDIPIQFEDLQRYINLPAEDSFYGAEIYAQIGSKDFAIVQSNIVESSRDYISPLPNTPNYNRDQLIELSVFSTDVGSFPGNHFSGNPKRLTRNLR